MSALIPLIDVHSHPMLPIGEGVRLAVQPDWSVETALALLDEHGISASVLSVPDAANHAEGQTARDISRRINEALAEIVSRSPSRFGALATVPGRDPDGALREIEYALDVLKLDGIATSTSVGDIYLGDESFDPWFDDMDRRAVTLFIHPAVPSSSALTDLGANVSMIEFMFDSTRMLLNMVLTGRKLRFPNIRMISTHAGGTMPFLVERVQVVQTVLGAGRGRATIPAETIREVLASFYYDLTASTSNAQLVGLLDLAPASRLLMGFDAPLMPAWSIQPAIAAIEDHPRLTDADRELIRQGNAIKLFPALARRIQAASP